MTSFDHDFDTLQMRDGTQVPLVRFVDPGAHLVGRLLMNDVQGSDVRPLLQAVEQVRSGRLPGAELAGNTTRLHIEAERSSIHDDLGDDETVSLPTVTLARLLRDWGTHAAKVRAHNRGEDPR